jgi:hypothetical protein
MLPEHESLIYKYFVELVRDCDLERMMRSLSSKDPNITRIMDNIKFEDNRRHNNRCILFQLLKAPPPVFHQLVGCLREHKFEELADKLENKPTIRRPFKHTTCCYKLPDNIIQEPAPEVTVCGEQLEIEVTPATKFCDTDDYCYSARSKNRGQVLIINNVRFDTERHQTRRGAEVDEGNLKELFVKIGLSVDMYRNLTRDEIKTVMEKFAHRDYEIAPDVGIVIIMSHGEKIDNKTVIIGSDGQGIEEEWIIHQFNNKTCLLFKDKPKILIFNICRYLGATRWS